MSYVSMLKQARRIGAPTPFYEIGTPGGRLTLESLVAVSQTDQSAKTTLYYTPDQHSMVWLYDGALWKLYSFPELSITLVGLTASKLYDVYLVDTAGVLTLEVLVWTNDTARATALVRQNGVWVKTGALTRLYLGSIYINATGGQSDDTLVKRYVYNAYNQRWRPMRRVEDNTSWSYASATIRQARASALNQLDLVVGLEQDTVPVTLFGTASTDAINDYAVVGIGLDSTTTFYVGQLQCAPRMDVINYEHTQQAFAAMNTGVGRHLITWLESRIGGGTLLWRSASSSAQSGLHAMVRQ